MKNPIISVDRSSRSIAIFDGTELVKPFHPYIHEDLAIDEAMAWCRKRTDIGPEIVYPKITSMKVTYSKPKKKSHARA